MSVTLTHWSPQPRRRKTNVALAYRVVTACVVAAAVLALLLLANSIVDYRYVSKLLTVQQVRVNWTTPSSRWSGSSGRADLASPHCRNC